jgi:PAS domain S-box-containing protein
MNQRSRRPSGADIIAKLKSPQEKDNPAAEPKTREETSTYHEELLIRNQQLMDTQAALEETRDRFIELYDFAPSGYFTLDRNGIIRQCNLTGAALLGKAKHALEGMPLFGFVDVHERSAYLAFLRRCRLSGSNDAQTELTIIAGNGPRRVQLTSRPRVLREGAREYLVALVDVTQQRSLEREREQIAREHAALAGRLITIQDEERLRIARNLHDDLGQQVTAVRLQLEQLAFAAPGDVGDCLTRVYEMLDQLDRRLHFVASELRPAILDLGIVAALEQFVSEWSATFGVQASFHSSGMAARVVDPAVETHLYRIAQEALNNVVKHAAARQVIVVLERRDDTVVLVVEDDGRGFDLETARRRSHGLGLVGMRERAQIVGGGLAVESRPGHGTSIFVHVPHCDLAG